MENDIAKVFIRLLTRLKTETPVRGFTSRAELAHVFLKPSMQHSSLCLAPCRRKLAQERLVVYKIAIQVEPSLRAVVRVKLPNYFVRSDFDANLPSVVLSRLVEGNSLIVGI